MSEPDAAQSAPGAAIPGYGEVMGARAAVTHLPIESTFLGVLQAAFEVGPGEHGLSCRVPVGDHLKQPMGIVHGGVYAAIAETLASMGAARLVVGGEPPMAVMGQSNNTTFLRPVTAGHIHGEAVPRHTGRTTQVWQIDMYDDDRRLCAVSQVTIAVRPMR